MLDNDDSGGNWGYRGSHLTEQQIQPFPTSIHSVTSFPSWLTVSGFSISDAFATSY